jgi:hypothetical protein
VGRARARRGGWVWVGAGQAAAGGKAAWDRLTPAEKQEAVQARAWQEAQDESQQEEREQEREGGGSEASDSSGEVATDHGTAGAKGEAAAELGTAESSMEGTDDDDDDDDDDDALVAQVAKELAGPRGAALRQQLLHALGLDEATWTRAGALKFAAAQLCVADQPRSPISVSLSRHAQPCLSSARAHTRSGGGITSPGKAHPPAAVQVRV